MSLIVKKFGGSSVANAERVFNVANIITEEYKKGNDAEVDEAIAKMPQINAFLRQGLSEKNTYQETVEQLIKVVNA